MTDLELDSDFNIVIDQTGDLSTVDDLEEHEQQFALAVTDFFFEHIGDRNTPNVVRKLRLAAQEAAEENDLITSIQRINVEAQEGDSLWLEISYNFDEELELRVI